MAYERKTTGSAKGDSLDAFVSNIVSNYSNQLTIRNAEEELKFNKSVVEDGLSLEDQLAYRKEQLKEVSDDPAERRRIRGEITSLTQRVTQKKFTDDYLGKLIDYSSGLTSIDTVIGFLNDQKATATDPSILETINQQLVTKNKEKFDLTSKLISDQTEYATKDKTLSVLETQIGKVTAEKTKALLAGNTTVVASLDLQLQSLNKAKTEAGIEKDITNFATSTITGYSSAVGLLDSYNAKISNSDVSAPITIGGVTYASAREFWTYKRDSYLADNSSSGFFTRIDDEVTTKVKVASSKNLLDSNVLQNYSKEISALTGRPELAGYETKIDSTKQGVLQTGANLISDTITAKYSTDYDLNKAVSNLNALKSIGVNTDVAYSKIIVAGANVKTNQIDSILSAAQNALANNPNLTPEQAINQAIAGGASVVKSPEELATGSEKDIATDITKVATGNTGANDPRLTVAPPTTTPAPATNTPASGASGYKTITVNPGDTLSAIALRELGSANKVSELVSLNNISNPDRIQVGQVIKIPTSAPSTPASTTAPTTTPAPATNTPAPTPTPQPTPNPTPTPQPPKPVYSGASIVDYLSSTGQDSSYSSRSKLATSKGITGYKGTADQNTQLLKALRGF